jgi:hypothetical protein
MKKSVIFYLPLLIFIMQQSSYAETFIKTYRDLYPGSPFAIELTDDGNLVVMSYIQYDGQLLKFDFNGNVLWNKKYDGSPNGSYYFKDFKKASDSGFIVTGYSYNSVTYDDGLLVKFDSDGNPEWTKKFGGDHVDRIYAISLVSTGGYIVVGESKTFDPENDIRPWIIRFDESGNIIWQKTYVSLGDKPKEVIENSDGTFMVFGGYSSAFIWKLNPDGIMIWDRTYDFGIAFDIIPTSDGGYIGISNGPSAFKLDTDGNFIWNKKYAESGEAADIFQTADGNYIITGYVNSEIFPWHSKKAFLLKIDGNGNRIFGKLVGGMQDEQGKVLVETPNQDIIVFGGETSFCLGNASFMAFKVNSSGEFENCSFIYEMDEYLEDMMDNEEFFRTGNVSDTLGNITNHITNVEYPENFYEEPVCPGDIFIDCDGDGFDDRYDDNCPLHSNPGQEDTYPPGGNGIGDACECEGNFDCDLDVDGGDAAKFKMHFGRSLYLDPCTEENPCSGDFDCDVDVDGSDAAVFKSDFSRSTYYMPCYICYEGVWCNYD